MGFNLNSVIVLVSAAVALVSAFFTWQMSTNETLVTLKSHVEQLQKKPARYIPQHDRVIGCGHSD